MGETSPPMNPTQTEPALDLLAVGAHPDDIELFAGGTIALLTAAGLRVAFLHLTRGECGTRGTPEQREVESREAARILGVQQVVALNLGDGRLRSSDEARAQVVEAIRRLRPRVVMTHHGTDARHPDHRAAHELVRDAVFFANVGGYPAAGDRHRVGALVYYLGHEGEETPAPDWVVDVTSAWDLKIRAMRAYGTQFHSEKTTDGPQTVLSAPDFWELHEARARRWGAHAAGRLGEPFAFAQPPHAAHPFVEMIVGAAKRAL